MGCIPQDIQQSTGIKELNKSPLLTKDKYFIWGKSGALVLLQMKQVFVSIILVRMDDSRDKMLI